MTRYVLGFAFNDTGDNVVLIHKNKPTWQAGRYNGVGGKIEANESHAEAIVREFYEEAGVTTLAENWTYFARIGDTQNWVCFCYYAFNNFIIAHAETKTEEPIGLFPIKQLPETISNLKWLIPAALNHKQNNEEFHLTAEYA